MSNFFERDKFAFVTGYAVNRLYFNISTIEHQYIRKNVMCLLFCSNESVRSAAAQAAAQGVRSTFTAPVSSHRPLYLNNKKLSRFRLKWIRTRIRSCKPIGRLQFF
jgi:hypothetical protein